MAHTSEGRNSLYVVHSQESHIETPWKICTLPPPTSADFVHMDQRYAELDQVNESLAFLKQLAADPSYDLHVARENWNLGDKLIDIRHIVGLARHFPDRRIRVDYNVLLGLNFIKYPENVIESDRSRSRPHTALISLNQVYEPFVEDPHVTRDQAMLYAASRLSGRDINIEQYNEPLFQFDRSALRALPTSSDVLIFPDAKSKAIRGENRLEYSRKSLSPSSWGAIFEKLDRQARYAIVRGTAFPDYCDAVIEQARSAGHTIDVVETDLNGIVRAILSTKKFVGMDSGTTHLADHVIKAAQIAGREIAFREIFAPVYAYRSYGISGAQRPTLCIPNYEPELSVTTHDIDPQLAADFISS